MATRRTCKWLAHWAFWSLLPVKDIPGWPVENEGYVRVTELDHSCLSQGYRESSGS